MNEHDEIREDVLHNRTDTSIAAASRISRTRGKIARKIVGVLHQRRTGATAEELATELQMKIQTVTARLVELHEAQDIAPMLDAKRQKVRRNTSSGRSAIVWKAGFSDGDIPHKRRRRRPGHSVLPANDHLGPKAVRVLRFLLDMEDRGVTCTDVEDGLQIRHQTASATLNNLKNLRLIGDTGRRRRGSIVWRILPAGRERLVTETNKQAAALSPDDFEAIKRNAEGSGVKASGKPCGHDDCQCRYDPEIAGGA